MKNKNPIHVPELREMLAAKKAQALRDFCETEHPAVIAELISALFVESSCARTRSLEMSCRVASTPPGYPFHPFDRNLEEIGNPIAGRVSP
jgi:hypothetical protein